MTQALTIDILWKLKRIGGFGVSPDGTQVVCSLTSYSMKDNRGSTQLWRLPIAGGKPRQLTRCGEKDGQPAFSPEGDRIAFVGKREQQGSADKSPQLYVIAADGGEARRASDFAPGVEAFRWMPDGQRIVFISWVWPELRGAAAQNRRQREFDERKESGYATSEGQYRYWDHNLPMGRVAHLLMLDVASGRVRDLFEGSGYELPREDPGLAHFDISPDGRRIAFVADLAEPKAGGQRLSLVELELRTKRFTTLADAPRWDFVGPRYSPDGQRIAVSAAEVGRHHMALGQLAVVEREQGWRGQAFPWHLDVQPLVHWSADGCRVHFAAEERGRCHAFSCEIATGRIERGVEGGWVQALVPVRAAGSDTLVVARDSATHPLQLHLHDARGSRRIDSFNDDVLRRVSFGKVQEVTLEGARGDEVQMWLVHPPRFDAKKKQPVFQVIHGGPYTAAGDTFGWRWNPHLLASRGHVVAQLNYHGSSGFGFDFRSSITGQMGQLESQDLKAATDWLLAQRWTDRSRVYAGGGSYGGYLVAWLNGHWPAWRRDGQGGPIRAYVCHAGVFDRVATWSADSYTQRHKDMGATYWADLAKVQSQSPATFAKNMATPTLVTHGALDYRVPDQNGLAYYNTLKARGVDARLLWFPDENHWVLKPRNHRQWTTEVFAWLERHGKRL